MHYFLFISVKICNICLHEASSETHLFVCYTCCYCRPGHRKQEGEPTLLFATHFNIANTGRTATRDAEVQPGIKRKFPKLDITCSCSWTKFNIPSVSVTSAGRRTAEILVNIVNSLSTSQPFYSLDEKINIKGPFWQLGS